MNQSDAEGIQHQGRQDRFAGLAFFDNPMFAADVPLDTPEQLFEWNDCCLAWAQGWLAEDAGRDRAVQNSRL